MTGYTRNLERRLQHLLRQFPVVAIVGARQAGKTTLARRCCPNWHYVDLEKPSDIDRVGFDAEFFFEQHPHSIVIDEVQEYPELFAVLRGVVDAKRQQKGRFVLTGSSSPALLQGIADSLAGRIAIVRLDPLKANEAFHLPLSPLYGMLQGKLSKKSFDEGPWMRQPPPLDREQLDHLWLAGGYPEPLSAGDEGFRMEWLSQYRDTYVNRDIATLFPRLDRLAYRRFVGMLAQSSGTILNKSDLGRSLEVSEGRIRDYLDIAADTFLWRTLPSFERDQRKSVIKMPKGHVVDSGLRHFLLGPQTFEQLSEHPAVGRSFESFVTEELLRGIEAAGLAGAQTYHYRTRNGAEVDAVIQGAFGTLAVEVKYGSRVQRTKLKALRDFVKERQLPFALLINHSARAEWLTPEILQLPAGWL